MHKHLSSANLEHIANCVQNQYYMYAPKAGKILTKIDPANMVKVLFGKETHFLTLSDDGSIMGIVCLEDTVLEVTKPDGSSDLVELNKNDIVLDISLQAEAMAGRLRFTIAHELAHLILVHYYPWYYRDLVCGGNSMLFCYSSSAHPKLNEEQRWIEWQANELARLILLPAEAVRQCVELFEFPSESDTRSIIAFRDIASFLGVSRQVLGIRMKKMGLVDELFLDKLGLSHIKTL